jgi:hypothetical protein
MPYCLAIGAGRLAGNHPDRIEVVDRVIDQLEPRRADREPPQVPRLIDDEAQIDVSERAEPALEERAQRQQRRAESQLQVHRGRHAPRFTAPENLSRLFEVPAHRLLHQHRGAVRQLLEDARDLIARHRQVEYGIRDRSRFLQCAVHSRNAERRGRLPRRRGIDIEDPRDGQPQAAIRGEMCGADDRAAADDHNGTRPGRSRPRLG